MSFFVLVYLDLDGGGRKRKSKRVQNDHNRNNEDDLMEKVPLGDMHRMLPSRRQDQAPAFAACLLVLDDTIRLNEWVAYHFTELPLSSLVIGLDPKSSMSSIAEIYSMSQRWSPYGLNIIVWPTDPFPKTYKYKTPKNHKRPPGSHKWRQETLVSSCTHHFLDKGEEEWLLLTDTDEFLSYNFIQPGENISSFDKDSIFRGPGAPSLEKRAADRVKALPIRRKALPFSAQGSTARANNTILSFIQAQRANNASYDYFPSQSGCTRIVGLTYGTNESESTSSDVKKSENLMTKRYQQHSKFFNDAFSKVMIELPKIKEDRNELGWIGDIHNPFPRLCGRNGKHSSGQDFMGSVLKVSHYVGSVESWLERGFGNGTNIRKQDIREWKKRDLRGAPYTDRFDTRMSTWYEKFEAKVGKDGAEKLLLRPIQERIEYVRSKLQLGQNMTDQGPVHYCGHRQWFGTTMTCDERVRFLTGRYQMTLGNARQSTVNDNCTCDGESEK